MRIECEKKENEIVGKEKNMSKIKTNEVIFVGKERKKKMYLSRNQKKKLIGNVSEKRT